MPFGLGTGFGIGVELPLSELELELNCKNGIDPSSDQNHPNVLSSVPIKCWEYLSTMVELRLNITVHSEKIFASLYYMNFTSTDDGINM